MIDPLKVWQSTLKKLPQTSDPVWAKNFAQWYAERIQNIQPDPSKLVPAGFVFVFNKALFAAELSKAMPTDSALAGIGNFAKAWETAILTTVYPATLAVGPGSAIPPPSPTTIFSVVNSAALDPDGIAKGKKELLQLVSAPPTNDAEKSLFAEKFRNATLSLTFTVIGLDSEPPPPGGPGPQPLTAAKVPLI